MKNKINFLMISTMLVSSLGLFLGCSSNNSSSKEYFSSSDKNESKNTSLDNSENSSISSSINESTSSLEDSSSFSSQSSIEKDSSSSENSSISSSDSSYSESGKLKCGHHKEIKVITPSTCELKGYTTYICLECGEKVIDDYKDKLQHDYSYIYSSYSNSYGRTTYSVRKLCKTCGTTQSGETINPTSNKIAYLTKENTSLPYPVGVVNKVNNKLVAYPTLGYEFLSWSNGVTEREIDSQDNSLVAIFKHKETELPMISFNLENGVKLNQVRRDEYKNASIIFEGEKVEEKPGTFKGRGNGSWVGANGKSGYTFKLESKYKPFNMSSKSKKWNIIACKDDESMHINYAAYNMARNALPGIEWQAQTLFVQVYINYEYRGVYMLTDAVKVENNRIPAKSEDDSGDYLYEDENAGFLVEYDRYATSNSSDSWNDPSGDLEPVENMSYFKNDYLYRDFSVKYPDPDDAKRYGGKIEDSRHKNAVLRIKQTMNNFGKVLKTGTFEELCEIVDINSMMDMYLVHELFKNSDVGWSSFYIYKKPNDKKLYFGPAWDFDLAATKSRTNETSGKHISTKSFSGDANNNVNSSYNDMFVMAVKLKDKDNKKAFADGLITRYKSLESNIIQSICDTTSGLDNGYLSFALNRKKYSLSSSSTSLSSLFNWLLERNQWMMKNNFVY